MALAVASALSGPARARTVCETEAHPGGEWRRMGYDYGHSRHQPAERTIGRAHAALLEPVWTVSANRLTRTVNNEITGYPIVADGCVFVGTSTGRNRPGWILALNAGGGDPAWITQLSHGVYSTLAVQDGVVYAFASRIGSPYVVALDERDGRILWRTTVDRQDGSDAVSSPIVYDGMVWVGVSGTAAEGDEETRFDFRGSSVLLSASPACDASTPTFIEPERSMPLTVECFNHVPGATGGTVLAHEWAIPFDDWEHGEGDSGGAIWSTISIDTQTKLGYVGTGNPFNYEEEHEHTNAMLSIDLDRGRETFGRIVASYKGDVEEYFPELSENASCDESDPVGLFLAGFECGRLDLDFGAAPNIFRTTSGQKLVGIGQKSGVYHAVEPACDPIPIAGCTLSAAWKQLVGVPSLVGGIVGTPAYDGSSLITPHTVAGYLVGLNKNTGAHRYISPVGDGIHWGNPVTSANGVVYTVDLKGFLDAYDAGNGAPLLHRPLWLGAHTGGDPTFSWGGVTVARNTVYASVGIGLTSAGAMFPSMPDGFVIAFEPAVDLPG